MRNLWPDFIGDSALCQRIYSSLVPGGVRMARRRRRPDRDDATSISSPPLRSSLVNSLLARTTPRTILQDLEDRREFSPELARPARAFRRSASKLEVGRATTNRKTKGSATGRLLVPHNLRFSDPHRVAVCVRRHQRREVLHALRHVGSGSGRRKLKKGRWSEFSDISCSRR